MGEGQIGTLSAARFVVLGYFPGVLNLDLKSRFLVLKLLHLVDNSKNCC